MWDTFLNMFVYIYRYTQTYMISFYQFIVLLHKLIQCYKIHIIIVWIFISKKKHKGRKQKGKKKKRFQTCFHATLLDLYHQYQSFQTCFRSMQYSWIYCINSHPSLYLRIPAIHGKVYIGIIILCIPSESFCLRIPISCCFHNLHGSRIFPCFYWLLLSKTQSK